MMIEKANSLFSSNSNSSSQQASRGAGTIGWQAPEIIQNNNNTQIILNNKENGDNINDKITTINRLSQSVDIFSLGCIFYYILTKYISILFILLFKIVVNIHLVIYMKEKTI